MFKRQINIGIIGTGRIGRIHAENITYRIPEATVFAVADVSFESAQACAQDFGIPHAYDDSRKIVEDPIIDAILICSPTNTHLPIIQEASRAGKHIFCEKPVECSLEKIDQALEAIAESGIKFQVGFNRRFDPNFLEIKNGIVNGRIGEPHIFKITSRDPYPPTLEFLKASGNLFLVTTIHDFDTARYLIGSEVKRIYAIGRVLIDPEIGKIGGIDTAVVTLEFENGAIGIIDNSWQAVYGYDQRMEVFGSKGMLIAENQTSNRTVYANAESIQTPLPLHFFMERYTESYVNELREFVSAILDDRTPAVTGIDARIPILMALAAEKSRQECRPVELAEVDTGVSVNG